MTNEYDNNVRNIVCKELGPLKDLLADDSVIEIMYNPDGTLWVERLSSGIELSGIAFTSEKADLLMRAIAHYNNESIGPKSPLLTASLPTGERFQGFLPPTVAAPTFCIRCNRSCNITLSQYIPRSMSERTAKLIKDALRARKNIIVSGGTSSGKTTLTSALLSELREIAPHDRLTIMEDTAEIQILHKNVVPEKTSKEASMTALLAANMRMRPDRIILGEVRGPEAFDLLKSWNTGHPGGISTLHANSALSALARFETLILEAQNVSIPFIRSLIADAVDIVIQIERVPGSVPVISEVIHVCGITPDVTYITKNLLKEEKQCEDSSKR